MIKRIPLAIFLLFLTKTSLFAQFGAAWIADAGYWKDGKAEFNIYDAHIVREGQARDCQVIHILVRESFGPRDLVKTEDWQQPGSFPVLKMNQIIHVPTGIYLYQQMHSNFWRLDGGDLVKFSLTSNDSCGNTFKLGRRPSGKGDWSYTYDTYWEGMANGEQILATPPNAYFYDELPMRVRTIDFGKPEGEFTIQLAPTVIASKSGALPFKPAKVSYRTEDRQIVVIVAHAGGTESFTLDASFPHLLLNWKMADGGELKLRHSLKIDYWKYNKSGDAERAINDPALRTPQSASPTPGLP